MKINYKKWKGSDLMTDKEKKILETFSAIIPKLSESDKSYLIGLGEGMAIKVKAAELVAGRR